MTIRAKYAGTCWVCGQPIEPGTEIDWDKSTKRTRHATCEPLPDEATYPLSGGSGNGCEGWARGQIVANDAHRIEQGEPAYLYVLSAKRQYIRDDGMSFGVGDDSGYRYTAVCREATAEEAAPIIEARKAQDEAAAAQTVLRDIARDIHGDGEYPQGDHYPAGETVEILPLTLYGGGEWFVVADEHIWAVRNNGADGDDWARNNVRTGGAGAVGHRVALDADLAARIRAAGVTVAAWRAAHQ